MVSLVAAMLWSAIFRLVMGFGDRIAKMGARRGENENNAVQGILFYSFGVLSVYGFFHVQFIFGGPEFIFLEFRNHCCDYCTATLVLHVLYFTYLLFCCKNPKNCGIETKSWFWGFYR